LRNFPPWGMGEKQGIGIREQGIVLRFIAVRVLKAI